MTFDPRAPKPPFDFVPRKRTPPVDKPQLYGRFFGDLANCQKLRDDIRDRAAYLHCVGHLPSHLRPRANQILLQVSEYFRRPTSLDGRLGDRRLKEDAIRDMKIKEHDMVQEVRERVSQGYRIQHSRGLGTRCGFSKVFMFKNYPNQMMAEKITVTLSGAVKRGWD